MTGEWITTDDLDTDALAGGPFIDWSDDLLMWDRITTDDLVGFGVMESAVRREQRRIERAIRGAIRAGYDGVDINRPPLAAGFDDDRPLNSVVLIKSIKPWHRPAPDGANGCRTERYTWDWFSEADLTALLRADYPMEVLCADD